jgi:predicted DNA-binding transcriptional regulator AlpA
MPAKDTARATGRLMGMSEIAERIGMTRQRALQITRENGFPEPRDVLRATPVWDRATVERYLDERPADRRIRAVRITEGRSRNTAEQR